MTDDQIINALRKGETLTFGCNGRNTEIMDLMGRLEKAGLIETEDMGLQQETRRSARWISKHATDYEITSVLVGNDDTPTIAEKE